MSEELDHALKELDELYNTGDFDEAKEKLEQAMESFGRTEPALVVREAELLLMNDESEEAIEKTNAILGKVTDPELLGRLHIIRGDAFYHIDKLEESREEQNAAVRLLPNSYDAIIGRALTHDELNYLNAAMLDLVRASTLDDEEGQPYAMQASIFMRWGQMEQCEEAYRNAVKRDKGDIDSRLQLARIHALKQQPAEAMELLTEIIDSGQDPEEDPEIFAPALLLRSQLSLSLNSSDAALEDAERAQAIIPDEPWAYLQIAATKIHAQIDPEKAITALKKAEEIVGNILDLPDLYMLYAGAYKMLGKDHKLQKYLEEAEGSPRLPGYIYGPLNPVENIPINPNRPIDFRRLLDDIFGSANRAPEGYEKGLRDAIQQVMTQLPEIREQNPGIDRIELILPQAPGMIGGQRSIIMELSRPAEAPAPTSEESDT